MVTSREAEIKRLVDKDNGTINAAIFSDPDIYRQELENIFTRTWLFVGHVSQIPNPGDFMLSRMGEEQVIVTRDRQGKVHVILNSCRHRGNMVCRYDQGHAFAFQCSFHGWVYNSAGELVVLPPGSEPNYGDMDKSQWGLLAARVEVFHGSIWANWDKTAPDFHEFMGGAEVYLKNAFLDSEGLESGNEEGGIEMLGGVMKWTLGMNWKVPMPDHDATHAWITHRSFPAPNGGFGLGGGNRVRVDNAGQSDYGISQNQGEEGAMSWGGRRKGTNYSISFPQGHTTSLFWPDDLDAPDASGGWGYNEYPNIRKYMEGKRETRRKNLGNKLVNIGEGPHVFPNLGFFGRVMRVLHPDGPDQTEMWSYFIVDKNAPPEVKNEWARSFETMYGPAGMVQKDDMENWYILTQYSKGTMTRRTPLNAAMRLGEPVVHGPSAPNIGMPGLWHPDYTDENTRIFYHRWAEMLTAKSWDDLRVDPVR
jgi:phenylpropionate dioxygenase-like ring-hydroxylating dioxygenase large terminal subunit